MPIRFLILSVTEDCNLRCRYCYARGGESQEKMSWEVAKKALEIAAASGQPFKVQLSGGEPLLNFPLIKQMVNYSREQQLPAYFQMQTNATLITRELAQEIKSLGIAIGVSLDGRVEINDLTRPLADGGSSTVALAQGLYNLKEAGVGVGLTCVISQENVKKLEQVIEMAYYLGNVYNIGFDLLRLKGRGESQSTPSPRKVVQGVQKALTKAKDLASLTGKCISFKQEEHVKGRQEKKDQGFNHCYAITGDSLFVGVKGELYPCGSLSGLPEFYLGNILEQEMGRQKIQAVSSRCQEWMAPCLSCSDFALCGGGCFARFYLAKHHPHGPECALKRVFIRQFAGYEEEKS